MWYEDAEGGMTFWEFDPNYGEYYTQDYSGVYWNWTDWEAHQQRTYFTDEQNKELSEAYAAYEGKLRSFAESRNLVHHKNVNRGFFPYKGGKGKGRGKGKAKHSSSSSSSGKGKGNAMMAGDAMAAVGSPGYSGCFICGGRDHEFLNCPKRSFNKSGKGSGVYMVASTAAVPTTAPTRPTSMENIYAAPVENYGQSVPSAVPSLIGHVAQPDLEGFAVLDTGATETITSLEALEFILNKRRQQFGEEQLQVVDRPPKVFRFGNGQTQTSESFVLIPQTLGKHHISLGAFTIDAPGVPLLLGIRSLDKLGAIIDCNRNVLVLRTIDAVLIVPLRKSHTGHLLIDLCGNWLQGGSRIYFHSDAAPTEKKVSFTYMVNEMEFEGESNHQVFHGDPVFHGEHAESRPWNLEACMQLMSVEEREVFAGLEIGQREAWLEDVFSLRMASSELQPTSNAAASTQQGMSLRLLAWLATAPAILTSDGLCHVVQWQPHQGEVHLQAEAGAAGEEGREIRLGEDLRSRPQRPSLQWPAVQRRSLTSSPGEGLRAPGRGSPTGSNAHGTWTACARCKMRLSYTPTWGAHALTRKAGALPADVETQVTHLGNEAPYSLKLRDKDIGLDGAEKSCLNQLEKVKAQKAAYHKETPPAAPTTKTPVPKTPIPKASTARSSTATPTVVNLEEADHAMLPGRKGRKTEMTPEELEAQQRVEAEDSPQSFEEVHS